MRQYLPQMMVATAVVAVLPVVVVWVLLADGVISSPWVCVGLAIALSLAATFAGSAYWKRRSDSGDVLFSEILLWGWLHRIRSERRLAKAVDSLGLADAAAGGSGSVQSAEQRAHSIRQMAVALDSQDPYTDGHSRRVALHASMIARKMGLSREQVAKIQTAGAVHDVGKLRVPAEVLNKPGALTAAEFEIVKRHVDEGAEIVSGMEDPAIAAMVRHHHERFDGTGYPSRLAGEEIPVGARVIAVADTFDALTSERPYRAAVPHKQALDIVAAASGTQLDPVAVRAFMRCYSGKRALLFWTLLAVSPTRAFAVFGGRHAGRATSGSAATVAVPAAMAAIVATAVGSVGTIARTPEPARFAAGLNPPATATVARAGPGHHAGAARDPSHLRSTSKAAKHATLGITVAHARHSAGVGTHPHGAGTGGGLSSGSRGGSSGSQGGAGSGSRGGSGKHPGGGSGTGTSPKSGSHPKGGGTNSGSHPGGGSTGPATPPTSPNGSTAGNGQGNGGGNGQGNGNPPGREPQSKLACMGGGWMNFGFANQGLCIAFVEHTLHASRHG